MALLFDIAAHVTATTGTGTITLGAALDTVQRGTFLTFADAGVSDGDVVSYGIIDRGTGDREVGTGTYTASGTTLSRTVIKSTNSDSAIDLSGDAEVYISPLSSDVRQSILNERTISASSSIIAADHNGVVFSDAASDINFTIEPNSSIPIPPMSATSLRQSGAGVVTAVEGSGVTIIGDTATQGPGSWLELYHTKTTDTWYSRLVAANHVPDPAGQPDGKTLLTSGDALVYGDPPAGGGGSSGPPPMFGHAMYTPTLFPVWETARRDVVSALSVYGQTTDSGHTFAAVNLDPAVTGIAEWHPDGYISCDGSPTSNHGADSPLTLIDDWVPTVPRPIVGMSLHSMTTSHWARNLIVSYIDNDNILYVSLHSYAAILHSIVGGVVTNLGTIFDGTTGGGISTQSRGNMHVIAEMVETHISASDIERGVQVSINGRYQSNVVGLPLGHEIFRDTAGKVGWGIGRGSRVYGFFAGQNG